MASNITPEALGKLLWPGIQQQINNSFKVVLDEHLKQIRDDALAHAMNAIRMKLDSMHQLDVDNIILQLSVDFGGGDVEKKQF